MKKLKKFLKDTGKVLLAIFIVTTSLLYALVFDGSEIPFIISFTACSVILFLNALKRLIFTIRAFVYLKKSDLITGEKKGENTFWRLEFLTDIGLFLMAGYFLYSLICILTGNGGG